MSKQKKSFENFGLVKRDPNAAAPTSGKLYVVMITHKWSVLKDQDGETIGVHVKSIGFLPVYHDRSLAERDYPKADIVTVDKTGLWDMEENN
jgi:hypothetical protein